MTNPSRGLRPLGYKAFAAARRLRRSFGPKTFPPHPCFLVRGERSYAAPLSTRRQGL